MYRVSVPVQESYTSTPLWAIRPLQSLSACTVELCLYSPYGPYGLYRASVHVQGWPLHFHLTLIIKTKSENRNGVLQNLILIRTSVWSQGFKFKDFQGPNSREIQWSIRCWQPAPSYVSDGKRLQDISRREYHVLFYWKGHAVVQLV
jgi:hypothetical protein